MKLTDEKRADMVREALLILTRSNVVTRVDCFGAHDEKAFKNWSRKLMLKFVAWGLVKALPHRVEEGKPAQYQVMDPDAAERISKSSEEIADLIWGDGPPKPFTPPEVVLATPPTVRKQAAEKPDLPGEAPVEHPTGPIPFVPPTSSDTPTSEEALAEVLVVMRQFGDLLIWMKDTIQKQNKKINEMHAILEQLK